jgi:protein involved in polysaccharide export with SLBB domain
MTLHSVVRPLLLLLLLAAPAGAQSGDLGGRGLLASRAALEERVAELEASGGGVASAELVALRRRLKEGDFQVGDRVFLSVDGEEALTVTFTVSRVQTVVLPGIGTVSFAGVLRSELEDRLTRVVAQYVRNPSVRASALIMLSVTGDVARPGYYALPVTALVSDAVMAAGGGTRDAKLKDVRVERSGKTLWDAKVVADAVAQSRTLDELGLRSGDQVVVPARGRGNAESNIRLLALVLSIPVTIYTLTRIF